jgi:ribosomal protein S21
MKDETHPVSISLKTKRKERDYYESIRAQQHIKKKKKKRNKKKKRDNNNNNNNNEY